MDTFLGLLELIAWILGVLALSASTTWALIKVLPSKDDDEDEQESAST